MTYKQTIDFLFASLPMFQRIGDAAIRKDLTNTRHLCEMLQQPQLSFPSVHVAGTNGKGSTSHMFASIFQAAGKKVGLYTSPHYVDFRERIRINGEMISEKAVVRFVEKYKDQWAAFKPSFFEITVAMAFDFFRNEQVDIAIIETGLGGRLDSTNIITPRLSIITNIGMDHMQMLGNTLPEIAGEKAGIIKRRIPVIIGEWQKETVHVFKDKARKEEAPLHFASRQVFLTPGRKSILTHHYQVSTRAGIWMDDLATDLTGPYQFKNVRTVLASIKCWNETYPQEKISNPFIKRGISSVKRSTGLIGRWMLIREKPLVIADAAHNLHGIMAMLPELLNISAGQKHFVLGFVADKDIGKILDLFPENGKYYWCSPDIPRGKPAGDTQAIGMKYGLKGEVYTSVRLAFEMAMQKASGSDMVFVGGSSYVVGDFLAAQ